MEVFLIFVKIYKWGKINGYLRWEEYFLIEAQNKKRAKRVAQLMDNSSIFSMDVNAYPDCRTLRKVKNQSHLEQLADELGFNSDDITLFSEEGFKEFSFPE
ncbi:MAG: hypothetical protein M3388_12965 [Acidobacteriota bacterium]|nr:hypothetical protein [Acidobacteriota bacterium]